MCKIPNNFNKHWKTMKGTKHHAKMTFHLKQRRAFPLTVTLYAFKLKMWWGASVYASFRCSSFPSSFSGSHWQTGFVLMYKCMSSPNCENWDVKDSAQREDLDKKKNGSQHWLLGNSTSDTSDLRNRSKTFQKEIPYCSQGDAIIYYANGCWKIREGGHRIISHKQSISNFC